MDSISVETLKWCLDEKKNKVVLVLTNKCWQGQTYYKQNSNQREIDIIF